MLMKKFYTLAIAALVAVSSVSAEGFKQLSLEKDGMTKFNKVVASEKVSMDTPSKNLNNVSTKDIDIADFSGDYAWSYTGLTQSTDGQTVTAAIKITKTTGNNYTISYNGFEFGASFSLMSQTLSIPANQDLGYNEANQIQVYLYHLSLTNGSLTVLDTPLTATIDGDSFVFGADEIIGIGNIDAGWFLLGSDNVFAVATGVVWSNPTMPDGEWEAFGTGTFADGWQVAAYGVDVNEYAWTVNIEKNKDNEGVYRMVNPYQNSPISNYNTDPTGEGYIVFSVADPEFVLVYPYIYSGLRDDYGAYLNTNFEGYYTIASNGQITKDQVISQLGITPSSFDEINGLVTFRNNRFGTTDNPDKLYNWQNQAGEYIVVDGSLQFNDWAGINGVTAVENENAPVEYYNLQGMRINNVENNPGLYIRKQGDKATKVYVK